MLTTRRSSSGFTLVEIIGVLVILALVGGGGIRMYVIARHNASSVVLVEAVRQLNQSSQSFVAAGGAVTEDDSPAVVMNKLQTPVDAVSRRAGFGDFVRVDYHWTLSPAADGDCIAMTYDRVHKRPVWRLASNGEGYALAKDTSLQEPAAADWSAVVDAKSRTSQVGARVSQWVWEYKDVAATRPGGASPTTNTYVGSVGPELNITGPTSITVPGSYYWSGTSSLPGALTITANGAPTTLSAATAVQSVALNYVAGDAPIVTQFDVQLTRAEGGSVTRTISINIAAKPTVTLNGPDTVTRTGPVTWTANCNIPAEPLSLRVPTVAEQLGTTFVSSTHPGWPADTHTTIVVTASALNPSGFDVQRKTVTINIPRPIGLVWVDQDLAGQPITARGVFHYTATATGAVGPVTITATVASNLTTYTPNLASPGSWIPSAGGPVPDSSQQENSSTLGVALATSGLGGTQWLIGDITLVATASSPGQDPAQATKIVHVEIPPIDLLAAWDVAVVGASAGSVASLGVEVTRISSGGMAAAPVDRSGRLSARLTAFLYADVYTVVGMATFNDGTAPKYSTPMTLNLTITP